MQLSVQGEISMTDQERKAMEMALEALEDSMYPQKKQFDAIIELRQALAQPEQEPVAWLKETGSIGGGYEQTTWGDTSGFPVFTAPPSKQEPVACECHRCIKENDLREGAFPLSATRMILCPECGNKRCPKASDHRLACTGSNEPGQEGSIYTAPPSKPWVSLTDEQIDNAMGKKHD